MESVSIAMPTSMVEELDTHAETAGRSALVRQAVEEFLDDAECE